MANRAITPYKFYYTRDTEYIIRSEYNYRIGVNNLSGGERFYEIVKYFSPEREIDRLLEEAEKNENRMEEIWEILKGYMRVLNEEKRQRFNGGEMIQMDILRDETDCLNRKNRDIYNRIKKIRKNLENDQNLEETKL
jgi:hypothetical protein